VPILASLHAVPLAFCNELHVEESLRIKQLLKHIFKTYS
jgi:hypothetical protein